jgi:nitrite reductase/ring-hydroxylating ferredoxin subunit
MTLTRKGYITGMPHIDLAIDEVPQDVPVRVEHEGQAMVVIRTGNQFVAFEDRCPHAHWPLSRGSARNGILECPGHGWEFNTETGRCLNAPAYCLKSVSVSVRENFIQLHWEEARPEPARQARPCSLPVVSA